MNNTAIGTTPTDPARMPTAMHSGQDTDAVDGGARSDLPPSKRVNAVSRTDRVELSGTGKALAALSGQSFGQGELQLSPEKLREMASG